VAIAGPLVQRAPGDFGSICLTSTAIRLRSTSTTPLAVELDDGAPAQAHYLMNRHRRGSENHHEVDADIIKGWHFQKLPELTDAKLRGSRTPRYG
jgi:hypothetical protein